MRVRLKRSIGRILIAGSGIGLFLLAISTWLSILWGKPVTPLVMPALAGLILLGFGIGWSTSGYF